MVFGAMVRRFLISLPAVAQLILFLSLLAASAPTQIRAEQIYIVSKHGSLVFTNRPTSLDRVVSVWRPDPKRQRVFYRGPLRASRLSKKFHELIVEAADRQGLDPDLIKAMVHAESSFNPYARSRKGAMGLMQLMPGTARAVGVRNPYEPTDNIRGGVKYLARLMSRYGGNLTLSLAAYNAGPQAVDKYRGVPPYRETREYVQRVIALKQIYSSKS